LDFRDLGPILKLRLSATIHLLTILRNYTWIWSYEFSKSDCTEIWAAGLADGG